MKVETSLIFTEENLTPFFKFQTLKMSKSKYAYYGLSLACAAIGVLMVIQKNYILGIAIIVLSAILMGTYPLQIRAMIKKQVKDMSSKVDLHLTFDEEGIHQSLKEKKVVTNKWEFYKQVCETNNYLYFYTDKYSAIIVNKNNLAEGDREVLIELANEHNLKYKKYNYE